MTEIVIAARGLPGTYTSVTPGPKRWQCGGATTSGGVGRGFQAGWVFSLLQVSSR